MEHTKVRFPLSADTSRHPSDTIFSKLNVDDIILGRRRGVVMFDDFTASCGQAESSTAFEWVGGGQGSCAIRWKAFGTSGVLMAAHATAADDEAGVLRITTDADNEQAYLQPDITYADIGAKISSTAGDKLRCGMEWRFRINNVTGSNSIYVGGSKRIAAANNSIDDGGADIISTRDFVGFRCLAADPDGLDAIHISSDAEVVVKESASGVSAQTLAASTWVKAGYYFDGQKVYWCVNGQVVNGQAGVLPNATSFPDAVPLVPFLGLRSDDATPLTLYLDVDWVKFAYLLK